MSGCNETGKRNHKSHTEEYDFCIRTEVKGAEKFKWRDMFRDRAANNSLLGRIWVKKVTNNI